MSPTDTTPRYEGCIKTKGRPCSVTGRPSQVPISVKLLMIVYVIGIKKLLSKYSATAIACD